MRGWLLIAGLAGAAAAVRPRGRRRAQPAPAGVEVRIDGAAIPDAPFRRSDDTFADAEAAPPLAIEIRRGGARTGSLDLAPDDVPVLAAAA